LKVSLKLKSGTKVEEEDGEVIVSSSMVILLNKNHKAVVGYCFIPGEIVRQIREGEYEVEF
jgi:hypothetical protein